MDLILPMYNCNGSVSGLVTAAPSGNGTALGILGWVERDTTFCLVTMLTTTTYTSLLAFSVVAVSNLPSGLQMFSG